MDLDEFRSHAHQMVDWMTDYLAGIEQYPVRAQTHPGEVAGKLSASAPAAGEPVQRIMADFARDVLPGVTHWQHPSFFAYFPANSSPPSVLAEMLTATIGAQCMMWQTSPAATEMETRVLDWLRQMIGLEEGFTGVIQDSASGAILAALLTAREKATGFEANEAGLTGGPELVAYCSDQTHTATEKGAKIAGYGRRNVRKIATDDTFAIIPAELEKAIQADIAAGRKPACAVASLGATGVGAIDDLAAMGEICRRYGVFFHVDAAWAGSALILPEYRWMLEGQETIDSLVFNPHKWLLTNFDCAAHFVRDPEALIRTFAIDASYYAGPEAGQVIDYRDWGVPLGRRFRALKLWFVIRSYGIEGLQAFLRRHIALAEELEAKIAAERDFELVAPRVLSLLNFRFRPAGSASEAETDALNERLLNTLNASGEAYFTPNRVRDRYAIRISIGQTRTKARHVDAAWDLIRRTARAL
ncbi:MAG: pyridoxal phosphate-dependent decarboxylase family protein [Minwuia sp.]|uniref:pyridoxal phosphate-dependent decarboxylase family protein n=1 Tax=Minwuia sp. TaxID=2493630 RepID=UPI003A8A932B